MPSENLSSSTIWVLWLFTLVLYGLFTLSASMTAPPLPAIILSIWLGSTLVATAITWNWIKSKDKDGVDH